MPPASTKTLLGQQAFCVLALLLMATTCVWITVLSQVSSPDYKALFWGLAPIAALHFLMVAAYFVSIRHDSRWLAFGFGTITVMSFGEFAWRIIQ